MKALEEISRDITYFHNTIAELKKELEYWYIIHKYISKAYNDIVANGWSVLESMIPSFPSEVEESVWVCNIETFEMKLVPTGEFVPSQKFSLEQRAHWEFLKTANECTKREEWITQLEDQLASAHANFQQTKTNQVQGAKRFEQKWNENKSFSFGEQQNLFP